MTKLEHYKQDLLDVLEKRQQSSNTRMNQLEKKSSLDIPKGLTESENIEHQWHKNRYNKAGQLIDRLVGFDYE